MEEEYQFQTVGPLTDEALSEFIHLRLRRNKWLTIIFVALLFAYGAYIAITQDDLFALVAIVLPCLILLVFTLTRAPRTRKKIRKMQIERYGRTDTVNHISFGEQIQTSSEDAKSAIPYDRITKIYECKHAFILMIGKHQGIVVNKQQFVKGTPEAFGPFILQSCQLEKIH